MSKDESCNTKIKPLKSKKNRYYISKHEYYELRHFCLQYNDWYHESKSVDATELRRKYASINMILVESAVKEVAGDVLYKYFIIGVTEDRGYDYLRTKLGMPCCREAYYKMYHEFFWTLSRLKMITLKILAENT